MASKGSVGVPPDNRPHYPEEAGEALALLRRPNGLEVAPGGGPGFLDGGGDQFAQRLVVRVAGILDRPCPGSFGAAGGLASAARAGKGALGLAQVNPIQAAHLGRPCGRRPNGVHAPR